MTKANPKENWWDYVKDLQLICIAIVATNAMNYMNDGFSWLGLGALTCGMGFVLLLLYLRNLK
jgi:hypothetical protein